LTGNIREKSNRKEYSYKRRIWKEVVPNDDTYLIQKLWYVPSSDEKDEVSVWPSFVGLAVLAPVPRTDHSRHKCGQEFTGIKLAFLHPATIS
jgi:hypothetical protein